MIIWKKAVELNLTDYNYGGNVLNCNRIVSNVLQPLAYRCVACMLMKVADIKNASHFGCTTFLPMDLAPTWWPFGAFIWLVLEF